MKKEKITEWVALDTQRDIPYSEYVENCEANDREPEEENSNAYWNYVNDTLQIEHDDFKDNMKYCKLFPMVAVGYDDLWNGKFRGGKVLKNVDDLLGLFCKCDNIKIWQDKDGFHINGYHHDGTNSADIRILNKRGKDWLNKNENEVSRWRNLVSPARSQWGIKIIFSNPSLLAPCPKGWGVILVFPWISNLGYHPGPGTASPRRFSAQLVTKSLHKKFINPIDKLNLINYIIYRNKQRGKLMELKFDTEPLIDSALDNIKEAMGSWDMDTISVSSKNDGYVVVVAVSVSDGKVDAVTSDCDVELAFDVHTCESAGKNTRWLIYVDSVDVKIKHGTRIIADGNFDIDDTTAIAEFIKEHIIFI